MLGKTIVDQDGLDDALVTVEEPKQVNVKESTSSSSEEISAADSWNQVQLDVSPRSTGPSLPDESIGTDLVVRGDAAEDRLEANIVEEKNASINEKSQIGYRKTDGAKHIR